jgi:TetR/AcrR family transcriptional regulator, fatty acid metabolism regulator protein
MSRVAPKPKRRTLLAPEDRRRQLLDAATTVFAEKGYRNAGVGDIIARAGVARGTFYLYFASKQEIFLAIVEDFHGRVRRALETVDAAASDARTAGPRAALQASFRAWLGFFAAHRDATRVILREASSIDPRFEKGFAELRQIAVAHFASRFRTLQQSGAARASIDPQLAAHLQIGMFDELLNTYVLGREHADLDALARQLADFEWSGVRPDRKE